MGWALIPYELAIRNQGAHTLIPALIGLGELRAKLQIKYLKHPAEIDWGKLLLMQPVGVSWESWAEQSASSGEASNTRTNSSRYRNIIRSVTDAHDIKRKQPGKLRESTHSQLSFLSVAELPITGLQLLSLSYCRCSLMGSTVVASVEVVASLFSRA